MASARASTPCFKHTGLPEINAYIPSLHRLNALESGLK
jgi:hypothetical protein